MDIRCNRWRESRVLSHETPASVYGDKRHFDKQGLKTGIGSGNKGGH